MRDLVIVSMHEKGFPQADFYYGMGEMPQSEIEQIGPVPDIWFSLHRGDTLEMAKAKATAKWPTAKIVEAADEEDDEND